MALNGISSCVKYLMFGFNLLFLITGAVIIGLGSWLYNSMNHYIEWMDMGMLSSPIILISVGIVICLVAFFGCCGAIKENHCLMMTFAVSLLLVVLVEMGVGIACYVKHGDLEVMLNNRFNETIKQYDTVPEVKKTFDMLQTDLKCCGVNGPSDWKDNIPKSCCAGLAVIGTKIETCSIKSKYIHNEGCLPKLLNLLKENVLYIAIAAIVIAGVQLLGVIFACCLACSIRKDYETV